MDTVNKVVTVSHLLSIEDIHNLRVYLEDDEYIRQFLEANENIKEDQVYTDAYNGMEVVPSNESPNEPLPTTLIKIVRQIYKTVIGPK